MYIGQPITSSEINRLSSKGRKSIKPIYAPSEKQVQLMDGMLDYYVGLGSQVQYAVTLQTKLVVCRGAGLADKQRISLEDDFRVFAKRLQREVYGMAHRRKPNKFSLMLLPSLEGSMFSPEGRRTLHYHVAIGNVPADMSADKLRKTIWDQWAKSAYGQMDIKFKPANEGWLSYITKEMEHGNTRCCDWGNTFVPECALRP